MASKYTGAFPSVYKTIDYQKKMVEEAYRLAYAGRPKEAHYPEGHPTPQFKVVFDREKGTYKFWSDASSKSASCDVDVATLVRLVYDKNFPWGLWKQQKYMNAHPDAYPKVPRDKEKPGDIGRYTKKGIKKRGHTFIIGKGTDVKEGSARNWFFSTTKSLKARLSMKGKKSVTVYRLANKTVYKPLKKGSKGTQVKNLQKFLNWYFKNDSDLKALKVDGDFGSITTGRVKLFQRQQKLSVDGVVGPKTLARMKGVSR